MRNEKLIQAMLIFGDEKIGANNFSMEKEIEIAAGKAARALKKMEIRYYIQNPSSANIYNVKLQRAIAETTLEDATKDALKAVKTASNKILWLNSQVKGFCGDGFVDYQVDKSSPNECLALIRDFYESFNVEILKNVAL